MNKIQSLSIDDLLDQLEDLQGELDDGKDYLLNSIIRIETALLKKIKDDPSQEYIFSEDKIKKDLIIDLVKYGTYLKTDYQKDDAAAKSSLMKALILDKTIPQAHYRLGFLAYKVEDYVVAVQSFQKAIDYQNAYPNHYLNLKKQQSYYAMLYLSNSALYVASKAQERSQQLTLDDEVEATIIHTLALSPLYELIDKNTKYLEKRVLQLTDCSGVRGGSWEEYEKMSEMQGEDLLLLDMAGREMWARYGVHHVKLSYLNAELLKKLMLHSSETQSLKKHQLTDLFSTKDGDIKMERYVKNISRLREKLRELNLPIDVIGTVSKIHPGKETSYFYRVADIPYLIIEHSDGVQ